MVSLASDKLYIYFTNGSVEAMPVEMLEEIVFDEQGEVASFNADEVLAQYECEAIDFLQIEKASDVVEICYDGNVATVRNPLAYEGVLVSLDGARVTVTSTIDREVVYVLMGQSDDAMLKLYGDADYELCLNGLDITRHYSLPTAQSANLLFLTLHRRATFHQLAQDRNMLRGSSTAASDDAKTVFYKLGIRRSEGFGGYIENGLAVFGAGKPCICLEKHGYGGHRQKPLYNGDKLVGAE